MPTIRDIAQRSGVSIGTVSNVLNNVPTVKEETRRKVQQAIAELKYSPNRAARSLASGTTQTLAFILPDICNPFFPEMVRGAMETANQHQYEIFLANIDNNPRKEIRFIENFIDRGVDGLIIATSDCSSKQVDRIRGTEAHVVIVDRDIEGLERDSVLLDNHRCGYMAAGHLVALGRRNIGLILGPMETMTARKRLEGAKAVLGEHGLFREALVRSGVYSYESGYQIMRELLAGPAPLDAVMCANDLLAIGSLKAAQETGLSVPDDLAIVGIDDILISRLVNPPLTTVRQPTFELGAIAAQMVIERIQGTVRGAARKVILAGELIVRGSTAGPGRTPWSGVGVRPGAVTASSMELRCS